MHCLKGKKDQRLRLWNYDSAKFLNEYIPILFQFDDGRMYMHQQAAAI